MCGIFGVINTKEQIDEARVLAARDVLAHRGPDDAGIYFSDCHPEPVEGSFTVALAHRRLSIIDLTPSGHQPMVSSKALSAERPVSSPDRIGMSQSLHIKNQESRYAIVFNGEIYNYRDLLCHSGLDPESMHSNSDTEIILRLFAKEGKECLNMLRGMFSFAIWDDKEKSLFAARDRFGIKPFYYLKNDDEFIFSSEIKAIKHYKKDLTISNEGIDAFLRTGSVPAPLTIYNEVHSLLPGNYLTMHNAQCSIFNYWKFNDLFDESAGQNAQGSMFSVKSAVNKITTTSKLSIEHSKFNIKKTKSVYDSNAKKKIRTALLDTIKAHMVSDVEVGAFLSGGIDSTAIVSLMRQVGQEKIKTVSVVFPDNKLDESKYARIAAKKYNTEHIEIPFYEKDLLDDFDNIMNSMDQPTIDGINTYFVSKAAKQAGLKVVLSGLGGDELFGGYPSFKLIPKYQRIKNLPFAKTFMKAAAPLLKNRFPAKAIHFMQNPDELNAEYKLVRGLFTDDELKSLGWISAIQNSKFKIQNLTDAVISKRAGESEKSFSHNSPFNTEHLTFTTQSDIQYPAFGIPNSGKQYPVSSIQHPASSIQHLSPLQYVSMMETTFYMRNQLLRDSDVFSMAHSLELRVPFVDHLLYKSVLPYLDSAFDKIFPKKMLVDAVGDIPLELINRPKMGFTFPFEDWISKGKLKDLMNVPKASLWQKNKDLDAKLNIDHSSLNINDTHWSRFWSLYVLSKFI
jgi:asparagine synthase (glutamine-hydrolysing)